MGNKSLDSPAPTGDAGNGCDDDSLDSYLYRAFALVFPRESRRRLIAMFRAYLDASGTHTGARIMCLAGYVAPIGAWQSFQYRWRRILHDSGVDGPFHMTDFMSGKAKPYCSWSPQKRARVLDRLIETIVTTVNGGIVAAMEHSAYRALTDAQRGHIPNEYMLCATACFAAVTQSLRDAKSSERIAYVFELGDPGSGRFINAMNRMLHQTDYGAIYQVLSVHFEDKRNALGLQAADMLAHAAMRSLRDGQLPPPHLRPLLEAKGLVTREITQDFLVEMADRMANKTPEDYEEFARAYNYTSRRQKKRDRR